MIYTGIYFAPSTCFNVHTSIRLHVAVEILQVMSNVKWK